MMDASILVRRFCTNCGSVETQVRRILREPLTLFLVLGLMLFALDRYWNGAPTPIGASSRIVITASQQAVLRDAFRAEQGRNPTAAELTTRVDRWVEEEVLYREALALNLDRADLIVHRQLTQKMRFLLEDATPLPTPSDNDLQKYLDQHAERYGEPLKISFQQIFLSRGRRGNHLLTDAAQLGALLQANPEAFVGQGDPFTLGQVITAATPVQLRREFGLDFSPALQKLGLNQWSGPITSGLGLHLVRVTGTSAFQSANLADVKKQVLIDYQLAQHERVTQHAIETLKKKYQVDVEALNL
jgi:peptidyl-prolyl cis-trans isomerase C